MLTYSQRHLLTYVIVSGSGSNFVNILLNTAV